MNSQRKEILEILRESLRIEIDSKQVYSGGMGDNGSMYDKKITVRLLLDDEEISSASLD